MFIFVEIALAVAFAVLQHETHYNSAGVIEWIISLIYIFYVWSFIIDFLPATRTRNKNDRFSPPIRAQDDEMAMRTQEGGNNLGGPVYTSGGMNNDASSYGSARPISAEQGGLYYPPVNGRVGASQNF